MPLPARMRAQAVVRPRAAPLVRGIARLIALLALVAAAPLLRDPRGVAAQSPAGDADLARASGSLTVTVGTLSGGAPATVPLEVYVARVLAGEGEPGAPEATQEALAIAVRTYAVFNAGRHRSDGFDLCDTTHCQVPRAATPASRRAALATAGRILTYQGAPAEIFYSASCGGRSETAAAVWPNANLPYLQSIEDDVHGDDELWTLERSLAEIEETLRRGGFDGSLRNVEIAARTSSDRVARLRLSGLRPEAIAGEQFRALMGASLLRSTAFSLTRRGNTLRFTGRGYGHGVGMCVIGAGRRGRLGDGTEEILGRYYPGLTVGGVPGVPSPPAAAPTLSSPTLPAAAPAVTVRAPDGGVSADEIARLARRARDTLAAALGVPAAPLAIELHPTLESFRAATGRPWWAGAVASGGGIDLAPAGLLAQRDGIEVTLRTAIAEVLVRPYLSGRSAWVGVGAARHFARALPPASLERLTPAGRCPSDAELMLAVSAAALRDAEARAEACFARAYVRSGDWRQVR